MNTQKLVMEALEPLENFIGTIMNYIEISGNLEDINKYSYEIQTGLLKAKGSVGKFFVSKLLSKEEVESKINGGVYICRSFDQKYFCASRAFELLNKGESFMIIQQTKEGEEIYVEVTLEEVKDKVEESKTGVQEEVSEVMEYNEQEQAVFDSFDKTGEKIKELLKNAFELGTNINYLILSPLIDYLTEMGIAKHYVDIGGGNDKQKLFIGFNEAQKIIEKFKIKEFKLYHVIFGNILKSSNFHVIGEYLAGVFGLKCREEKIISGLELKLGELMKELKEIVEEKKGS